MKGLALLLALSPAAAFAGSATVSSGGDAWVVVVDEGEITDRAERHALRALAVAALRGCGVAVANDARTRELEGDEAELCLAAARDGIESIFVLRLGGRLEARIPLSLERLSPADCRVGASATLPATGLREAEKVVPRLTAALFEGKRPEATARQDSVLAKEAEPELRRPVEKGYVVGFSAPGGFAAAFVMDMKRLRLDVSLLSGGGFVRDYSEFLYAGVGAAWLPSDREISPYVGGGIGIMGYLNDTMETDGAGARFEAGIEFARLHKARVAVGAEIVMAFFDPTKEGGFADRKRVYPGAYIRLRF